jgi:hypothetical protein
MLSRNSFTVYAGSFGKSSRPRARRLGLPADSVDRVLAAADHALQAATLLGHCFLPRAQLVTRNAIRLAEVVGWWRKLARERFVVERAKKPRNVTFVGHFQTRAAWRPPSMWKTAQGLAQIDTLLDRTATTAGGPDHE